MRIYHDGILITNEKEIIFKNKLLSKLLSLSDKNGFAMFSAEATNA
jgi:hypothetical protein